MGIRTTIRTAAILLALAAPGSAMATGSLGCSIDDQNIKFDFEALFSYSDIGGLFQLRGRFESKNRKAPKPLQAFDLAQTDLKQQWMRDKQLKLMIYRETEGDGVPFGSVKLIIEASQPPEEDFGYSGRYKLTIEPSTPGTDNAAEVLEGDVGCSAG